jgi:hypothetical protein
VVSKKSKKEKKAVNKRFVGLTDNYVPTGGYEPTGDYQSYDVYTPTGDYIPTGGYVPTGDYEHNGLYVPTGDYIPTGGYCPTGGYQLNSYVSSGDYLLNVGDESSDIPLCGSLETLFEENNLKSLFLLKGNPEKLSLPKGYIIPPIILV